MKSTNVTKPLQNDWEGAATSESRDILIETAAKCMYMYTSYIGLSIMICLNYEELFHFYHE